MSKVFQQLLITKRKNKEKPQTACGQQKRKSKLISFSHTKCFSI